MLGRGGRRRHVQLCTCVLAMWRPEVSLRYLKCRSPRSLWQGLSVTWSLPIRLGCLARPRDLLVSAFPVLDCTPVSPPLSFSRGYWSTAHTLPRDPAPHCSSPLKLRKSSSRVNHRDQLEHRLQKQPIVHTVCPHPPTGLWPLAGSLRRSCVSVYCGTLVPAL